VSENLAFLENNWIGDSGTSCHYINNDVGLFDVRNDSKKVTVGKGKIMDAKKLEA
jgi:hypothetical protein